MKTFQNLLILVCLVLVACTSSKKTTEDIPTLKKEAKIFSMKIIETYFASDCDTYIKLLDENLIVFEAQKPLEKEKLLKKKEDLCSRFPPVYDDTKTIQDYLRIYKTEVFSKKEFEALSGIKLSSAFKETDIAFVGSQFKDGYTKADNFILDDGFWFIVRKENKKWTLKTIK
ncbi:MAG: hypothetical protein GY810_32070 [Aureispira sp.]|nr:hypothetical protein [Aureispira sp.]